VTGYWQGESAFTPDAAALIRHAHPKVHRQVRSSLPPAHCHALHSRAGSHSFRIDRAPRLLSMMALVDRGSFDDALDIAA